MAGINKIAPCLWFDTEAEDAARFYCSIFPNSKIDATSHYGKAGIETHGRPEGSVMFVAFTLDGEAGRAERRSAVQVQRSHFIDGLLQGPGGDRSLLEQALRRRRAQCLR